MIHDQDARLDYALKYRQLGWSIIPVDSRKKGGAPFSWAPYQESRPTPQQLKKWLDMYPQHGLAVVCGEVSDLIVLDLDRHGESDGVHVAETLYGWEPTGPVVKTGGGGLHAYYRHPGGGPVRNRTGAGSIAPGVELKADGGFVYAPPSIHVTGTPYEWLFAPFDGVEIPRAPEWLMSEIEGAVTPPLQKPDEDGEDEITRLLQEGVSEGERNDAATRIAGRYLAMGVDRAAVLGILKSFNMRCSPPLPVKELESVVTSIAKKELFKRGGGSIHPSATQGATGEDSRALALQALSERFGIPIDDIVRVGGSEPYYRFHSGGCRVDIEATQIGSQWAWRRAMIAVTQRVPRKIGQKADPGWDAYLQQMLDLARQIDPGEEGTQRGELREWVRTYAESHKAVPLGEPSSRPRDPRLEDGHLLVSLDEVATFVGLEFNSRVNRKRIAQLFSEEGFSSDRYRVEWGADHSGRLRFWAIPRDYLSYD